jgi:transcriptional regulator of arginine metabolism
MSSKRTRQKTILELVRLGDIDSQQRLAEALNGRGFRVSQSTLSRDIQELGLVKAGNLYTAPRRGTRRSADRTLKLVLAEFVVDIDDVGQILVLKTARGSAAPVSEALDEVSWPDIAATLAGDDTIFVLCRSAGAVRRTRDRIEHLLES